jgi:hypothetical protein
MTHRLTRGRARTLAIVVAALLTAGVSTPVLGQRDARQRHVIVGVTDKNDKPVEGLTERDFTIREDNALRELISASPAPPATHVVLLVDDSQATQGMTIELRAGIKALLGRLLNENRETAVRITTIGERPTVRAEFATSLAPLNRTVDQIVPKTGAGGTLLEAIMETCRDLRTRAAARPVIIAFVNENGPEFGNDSHTRVAEALKSVHAPLWTIVFQSPGVPGSDAERERAQVLTDVAVASGGMNKTFLSKQGIEPAFATVAQALVKQYDLVYARPDVLVPPSKLDVQTRDKSLRVIAPRWTGQ